MFNKTVIPLDDRKESAAILPPVSSLVKAAKGQVVLLTVLSEDDFEPDHVEVSAGDGSTPEHGELLGPVVGASAPISSHSGRTGEDISPRESAGGERPRAAAMAEAVQRLETHAAALREDGIGVTIKVTHGDPQEEVLRVIKDESADSLAIATHRQSAIARTLTGSLTDALIQESLVPVLSMHAPETVEEGPGSRVSNVIVAVDGTEFGEIAVEPAIELAASLGAKLLFVQAVQSPAVTATTAAAPEMLASVPEQSAETQTAAADEYLSTLVQKAEASGIKAVAASHFGSAGSVIVSVANSHENSIVVMASHARSGLARTVLGSNADEVVRNLKSPVVVIKDHENDK